MKKAIILSFALFSAISLPALHGEDLPEPLSAETFGPLFQSSPFTRALNLSDSLILSGLARVDGEPVATILDQETSQTHVVSSQKNQMGWRLTEVSGEGGLETLQVTLDVSGQLVTIRHNPEAISGISPQVSSNGGDNGDRGRDGERHGKGDGGGGGFRPDPELMKRFYSLSEESRSKFREQMMKNHDKMGDLTPEQRMENFKNIVNKLESDEKGKKDNK